MIPIDNQLKEQVAKVLKYSQGLNKVNIDNLLETWATAKEELCSTFFQGALYYKHPHKLTFSLDDNAKIERFDNFIGYVIDVTGGNIDFIHYLQQVGALAFYDNKLQFNYSTEDGKTISAGTKIIKSFKYFVQDRLLEDIQNKASELIQENKVEGYLTFSIHPLDFLSSSENTFNWRSCHALDGEYRAGNLSYMGDSSTVICFLQGEEDVALPRFPGDVKWNSKKWRMLLHFDEKRNVVFAGRQYPFSSPGALDIVREVFYDCMVQSYYSWWMDEEVKPPWSQWHNDYITEFSYSKDNEDDNMGIRPERYAVINRSIYDKYKIVKDAKNSKHFNDITRSSCYMNPYYMFIKTCDPYKSLKFTIGSETKCISCGDEVIDGWSTMMCPNCELDNGYDDDQYAQCECCGNTIYRDYCHWVSDECICEDCYRKEAFACECCGEEHYNSHKRWNETIKKFVCEWCDQELERRRDLNA